MLKFDITKARFDYVQVSKITANSIYVVSDRNGSEYVKIDAPRSNHNGRLVRKVKIHERVSRGYFLYNTLKEFSVPRSACLFVYDGEVLGIELQRFSYRVGGFEDFMTWVCYAERCMGKLERITKDKEDVFINGTEVYWPSRDSKGELYDASQLDMSNNFHLCSVDYVRLNRIGIASYIRQENKLLKGIENPKVVAVDAKPGDKATDLEVIVAVVPVDTAKLAEPAPEAVPERDAMLVVQTGAVLRFTSNDGVVAYSPVLKNDLKIGSKHVNESKYIRPFFSGEAQMKPNLVFVKLAGTVIGGIYGMPAVDFLNIPEIIEKTGEVCLFNIEERYAASMCLDMDARVALAWLLGFLGKETRLNEMHSLNRMFRSLMKSGFTKMKKNAEIDAVKDVVGVKELPLVAFKTMEQRSIERKQKSDALHEEYLLKAQEFKMRNAV